MKKICYIFPEYNEKTTDHFYHHYELLRALSGRLDIFLIVEKGAIKKVNFGNFKHAYVQRFKFVLFRFLESFFIILLARILGYKTFYTHYCYIGAINAGIISRILGGKSYYWHCEMIWEFKQKTFSRIGFNLALKLSHFLVTGSEKMKEGYAKHYNLKPDRIKVMPNWINLNRFKVKSQKSKVKITTQNSKIILFVHWLSKRKGAHLLVPIVNQLSKILTTPASPSEAGRAKYKLLIIGEGPLKERIIQEAKENKLENFVEVLGKIPHKDLIDYYSKADVFVLPSMQEGFPRVLLEAMASGIPYVAFDVGAVREISPKLAQDFIVERGNIEEFAEKIKILLSDEKVYNQFKKEELERAKEYSLESIIDKFIGLFL